MTTERKSIYKVNKNGLLSVPALWDLVHNGHRIVRWNRSPQATIMLTENEYYTLLGAAEAFIHYGDTFDYWYIGDYSTANALRRHLRSGPVTKHRCWK